MVKKQKKKQEDEGGLSLDDAFADDDDVEYAKPKSKKEKKKKSKESDDEDLEDDNFESPAAAIPDSIEEIQIASKPISKLKRGDKIKVDSLNLEVDTHEILIDHGTTKEMSIDCFDPKTEKDYQLRYFSDQPERTMELYELQEIMYVKKPLKKVEW